VLLHRDAAEQEPVPAVKQRCQHVEADENKNNNPTEKLFTIIVTSLFLPHTVCQCGMPVMKGV
jgi:hypothetical protein